MILLSIIVALGIIFLFSYLSKAQKTKTALTQTETQTKVQEFMVLDTDGDGLKDWEEALWKTDPKVADTDKDGTSDGEEIDNNRDPLKTNLASKNVAPTDKIDQEIITNNKKVLDDFEKLSETDKMGRLLFSQYLATKKIDQPLTNADISSIVQNTLSEIPTLTFKQYTLFDLTVSSSATNTESIKKYGNDIAGIMMTDLFNKRLAEKSYDFYGMTKIRGIMQMLQDDVDQGAIDKAFAELSPIISDYKILITDLLKVPVPNNLANNHILLINSFELIRDNLSQIQKSVNNIVVLPSLLTNYSANISNLWDAIAITRELLTNNKVIFTANDVGNQLFNGIMTTN